MHRVLICGDRNWKSQKTITTVLCVLMEFVEIECIIEGEARGADRMGATAARELGFREEQILKYPAEWDKYRLLGKPKAAGPIRNRQMLKEAHPSLVLAFHKNIDKSSGTADMVRISQKAGLPVIVIDKELAG